ncbi:fructose PTS transporter subunit IIA, partial [Histophilus somni]|uniref:fructose PTS transporter subunit IIA n=1 Tax=Histophilus somni TaxID=731 RepID=UPI00201FADCC
MKIKDLLKISSISLGQVSASKEEIIKRLAGLMGNSGNLSDKDQYIEDVKKREASGSTGIGDGVAIPHAKSKGVARPGLAAMTVPQGTDYEALDGEDTKLFFMIAVPESSNDDHLVVLSRLSTMLMDQKFISDLLQAKDEEEFLRIVDSKEKDEFPEELEVKEEGQGISYDILAVTGCPTGIAHTYMAEKAIKDKAKEMGLNVKVETHGSRGVENQFTQKEIDEAKGIIIAADVNIEKNRFDGKRLVST